MKQTDKPLTIDECQQRTKLHNRCAVENSLQINQHQSVLVYGSYENAQIVVYICLHRPRKP